MAERSRASRAARRRRLTRIINPRAVPRAVYLVPHRLCDYNFSSLTSYLPSSSLPRSSPLVPFEGTGRVAGWPRERERERERATPTLAFPHARRESPDIHARFDVRALSLRAIRASLAILAEGGGFSDTAADRGGSIGDVIGAGNRAGFRLH